MHWRHKLARLLAGADPKQRRMLGYWAASGVFYALCIVLMWISIDANSAARGVAVAITAVGVAGLCGFYLLLRASARLGIAAWQLAFFQALYALVCNLGAYSITGPIRGASLMASLVVVVFCMFSMRPRQTMALCALFLGGLGLTSCAMVMHDPISYTARVESIHFVMAASCLLAIALLTGEMTKLRMRLKQQKEELLNAVATIRKLATVDELTSLANRRHMNEVLCAEEGRGNDLARPVCMALLDIDFFKSVNDTHGHAVGDAVLRNFAIAARAELRSGDVLARWGGEEFLLLLPDTVRAEALRVLERMARRVEEMSIPELDINTPITFSGGVVERSGLEPFADTITRADKAMYVAKSSGRNRIVAH